MKAMKALRTVLAALLLCVSATAGAERLEQGFKGIVETGYGIGVGGSYASLDLTLTAGWQLCPVLYAGVGMGYSFYDKPDWHALPFYGDVRVFVPTEGKITPYLDVKAGYSALDVKDYYVATTVGLRRPLGAHTGVSLGMGYERAGGNGTIAVAIGLDF